MRAFGANRDGRAVERVKKGMGIATTTCRAGVHFVVNAVLCLAGGSAAAQVQRVVSLDATLGLSYGLGGAAPYTSRLQAAADVLGAVRVRPQARHSPVFGASVGWIGRYGDQACAAPCPVPFPRARYRALYLGWERLNPRGTSLRLLGGPSWDAHSFHVEGVRRGWHVRADAGTPGVGPLAPVVYVQAHTATSGPSGLGGWGGGVGVRLR